MDIVLLAKKKRARGERPVCIYVGDSRDEARAAGQARASEFEFFYFVNPEPYSFFVPEAPVVMGVVPEAAPPPAKAKAPAVAKKPKAELKAA